MFDTSLLKFQRPPAVEDYSLFLLVTYGWITCLIFSLVGIKRRDLQCYHIANQDDASAKITPFRLRRRKRYDAVLVKTIFGIYILIMFCIVSPLRSILWQNIPNTKKGHDFENLVRFLSGLRGRNVLYVQNPGNAGDSLIDLGFFMLANTSGLEFSHAANHSVPPSSDVVLYGGGGNLVPYYPQARRFIEDNVHNCNLLVVLPHTVYGHHDLFMTLPRHVHVWARETTSYKYLKEIMPYPEHAYLTQDMVFALENSDLIASMRRAAHVEHGKHLIGFRDDKEKHPDRPSLPSCNKDVSQACGQVTAASSFDQIFEIATCFVQSLLPYETVHTDRLHVGIVASLLNKSVHLYPGCYWKVHAIYEHSMKGHYPATVWHDDFSEIDLSDPHYCPTSSSHS